MLGLKVGCDLTLPDEIPIFADYIVGNFLTPKDYPDLSVVCQKITIDKYHLLRDNCKENAEGTKRRIAQAISNGSFILKINWEHHL